MANIHDQEVNLRQGEEALQNGHPLPDQALRNNEGRADSIKISIILLRAFFWICMLMIAATNILTSTLYFNVDKTPKCSLSLAPNNYLYTATLTFIFTVGYNEYFLVALFLKKEIPKSESNYLLKFSIFGPSIVFLVLSDYFETRFNCRPSSYPGFLLTQLFTVSSMILVVFTCLYTLSNLYQIWLVSQRGHQDALLLNDEMKSAFKDCLDSVRSNKGIDKFKKFASDFMDVGPSNQKIRFLVYAYSLAYLEIELKPKDLKHNAQIICVICEQFLTAFQRVIPATKDKELEVCHPSCLYSRLTLDDRFFLSLQTLSSLLTQVTSKVEPIFDLGMLKTI